MFAKHVGRDVNVFIFFEKRSFSYENDDEKSKLKRSFFSKAMVYKKQSYKKWSQIVFKTTIVF